eukprot:1149413-Pelagomonas_calceolata.AAC.7
MSGEVLWDDTDGSAIGVDVGEKLVYTAATKKQKQKGKAWWWQCVSVVLVAISATQVLCKLQCKLCKALLSPSNPPDVCKSHLRLKNCKAYRKGAGRSGDTGAGAAAAAAGDIDEQQMLCNGPTSCKTAPSG